MIRVSTSFDLVPGADIGEYRRLAERAIEILRSSAGFIDAEAGRNALGSPYVNLTVRWDGLEAWARALENPDWIKNQEEIESRFIQNVCTNIWRESPLFREKIAGSKK